MGRVNHEIHSDRHIKRGHQFRFEHVIIVKNVDTIYSISKTLIVDIESITRHRKPEIS